MAKSLRCAAADDAADFHRPRRRLVLPRRAMEHRRRGANADGRRLLPALSATPFLCRPCCTSRSACAAAFLGGALWAAVPALLRVFLSVNELVVCLMMNPIALLLTGYVSARVLKAPGPTNKLPDILDTGDPAELLVVLAAQCRDLHRAPACASSAFINAATVRGFEWKILGLNPRFAYYGGMNVGPQRARCLSDERRRRRDWPAPSRSSASTRPSTTISRRDTGSTASRSRCSPRTAPSASYSPPFFSAR